MSKTKAAFRSHESRIFDAIVADVFSGDLNEKSNLDRALATLTGGAVALKAIGSKLVEGPILVAPPTLDADTVEALGPYAATIEGLKAKPEPEVEVVESTSYDGDTETFPVVKADD